MYCIFYCFLHIHSKVLPWHVTCCQTGMQSINTMALFWVFYLYQAIQKQNNNDLYYKTLHACMLVGLVQPNYFNFVKNWQLPDLDNLGYYFTVQLMPEELWRDSCIASCLFVVMIYSGWLASNRDITQLTSTLRRVQFFFLIVHVQPFTNNHLVVYWYYNENFSDYISSWWTSYNGSSVVMFGLETTEHLQQH